ncbi:hypothetical protein NKH77_15605 [Streptomyces sp. M19]
MSVGRWRVRSGVGWGGRGVCRVGSGAWVDGKVGAITFARERGVPLLGLCLGLQCIVIEAARNLAGWWGRIRRSSSRGE